LAHESKKTSGHTDNRTGDPSIPIYRELRGCAGQPCDGDSPQNRTIEKDPEYREAFELAKEDAADILEAEAFRRGV